MSLPIEKLQLPKGFEISVFATDVENARQLAWGDQGTIFAGSRAPGLVHAIIDSNNDGKADEVIKIANGLTMPSGIAFKDGALYVAEVHQVLKYSDIESRLKNPPKPEVVVNDLPTERHHGWKYIDFSPDGWLHVPIGTPCNVCLTKGGKEFDDPRYDSIVKYNLKTGEKVWVANGVRNSVGFDWHPATGDFWFSDNGRDWMGDDLPPCEINHVSQEGQHFGYPFIHGADIQDPEFGKGKNPNDYKAPAAELGAHVAPLGIHFYNGKQFPAEYKHRLFVAEHGSWNRTKKAGYRIMMGTVKGDKVVDYQPFIEGWLEANEDVWGRPVAFLAMPDGSLLLSDDFANAIYRISYQQ